MGCGGSAPAPATTQQQIDPRMQSLLYGTAGGMVDGTLLPQTPGIFQMAANTYLGKNANDLVAGFNPLQQSAISSLVKSLSSDQNYGGRSALSGAAQKLLAQGGLKYQPTQMQMPQVDLSTLFNFQQPQGNPALLYPKQGGG